MKVYMTFILILSMNLILTEQQSISFNLEGDNRYQKYYRDLVKLQNLKKIDQFNQDEAHTFNIKPNKFLQLKNDEFHSMYTMEPKIRNEDELNDQITVVSPVKKGNQESSPKGMSIEDRISFSPSTCDSIDVDWSIHTTGVRDQGTCNSCYAHSALATIEAMMHVQYGIKYDLSQQQITQCSFDWAPKGKQFFNNKGCIGGWGFKTMAYVQFVGVTQEINYPYTAGKNPLLNKCDQQNIPGKKFKIKSFTKHTDLNWPESQCNILNEKLLEGKTIAVSIWAPRGIQYQFYGSQTPDVDIYNMCGNHKEVNHELQLVGSTDRYWKLKNSYGPSWGQKGYLYLDKSKGLNCLNICMDFAYPNQLADNSD